MKDRESHLNFREMVQEDFDRKNLSPIEEIIIGSTPEGSSFEGFAEDVRENPDLFLTPNNLTSLVKDKFQIERERLEKRELDASGLFDEDTTCALIIKGQFPTMRLSSLDASGRVPELRIGRKNIYTKELVPYTDEEIDDLIVREELRHILSSPELEDGLLIFKHNLEREEDDDVA